MGSDPASGVKCEGSLARWDHDTSSWKTFQPSLFEDLTGFSGTWPSWGWMRNGIASQLQPLEHLTSEDDSGLLPTPTASDAMTHHSDTMRFDSLSVKLRRLFGFPSHPNPRFLEWMMGYPTGWSDCTHLVTPLSLNARK